jgi:hypothetical protein
VTQSRSCFDNGRKVAEIGAALAYADTMARRLPFGGGLALRDLSAGLHTAAAAAERIQRDISGQAKSSAGKITREIKAYNENLRRRWIEPFRVLRKPTVRAVMKPGDAAEIRRNTSSFRQKVMHLWDQLRQKCR